MPSLTTLSFTLNFPPKNCQLSILAGSTLQYALETIFEISMSNCDDENTPISY